MIAFYKNGLGEILALSSTVSVDTVRQKYFSPQTGQDYASLEAAKNSGCGADVCAWPITWYDSRTAEEVAANAPVVVTVPTGPIGVAQTVGEAESVKAITEAQLRGEQAVLPQFWWERTGAISIGTPPTSPAIGFGPSSDWEQWAKDNWLVLAAVGVGALMLLGRGR